MNKAIKKVSLFCLTLLTVLAVVLGVATFKQPVNTLAEVTGQVYGIDFSDTANRGDNKVGDLADATIVGTGISYTENAINGKTAINFPGTGVRQNYISIDKEVINNDVVTFATWMKLDKNPVTWSRPLHVYKDSANRLEIMPTAQDTVLNISLVIGGQAFHNQGNDSITWEPTTHTNWGGTKTFPSQNLQMVYGGWAHYAYTFESDKVSYYVNGELAAQYTIDDMAKNKSTGSFSLKQLYGENTKVAIGATHTDNTTDWKGSVADFKVFNKALTEAELKEISGISKMSVNDFIVSSYDFEDTTTPTLDSVRGYNGTLNNTATVAFDGDKNSNVLVLDGNGSSKDASYLALDSNVIKGFNQFTVALDVNIKDTAGGWARIFDFAPGAAQQMVLAVRWGGNSSTVMNAKYTTDEQARPAGSTYEVNTTYDKWNTWHNVILSVDGETANIYIDGVLANSGDFKYSPRIFSKANETHVTFGGTWYSGDKGTPCSMDNIKIFSKALDANDVKSYLTSEYQKEIEKSINALPAPYIYLDNNNVTISLKTVYNGFDYLYEGDCISYAEGNYAVTKIPADGKMTVKATVSKGDATVSKDFVVTFDGAWVDAKAPDCVAQTNGNVKYFAFTSGEKFDENLNKLDDVVIPYEHDLVYNEGTAKNCLEDYTLAHYKCEVCERLYLDENATEEIDTAVVVAKGHTVGEYFGSNPATCLEDGNFSYNVCKDCGIHYGIEDADKFATESKDFTIAKLGHGSLGYETIVAEPNCEDIGYEEHYVCNKCGEVYLDDVYVSLNKKDFEIPANGHDYVHHDAIPGDCENDTTIEHYTCNDCDKLFNADKEEVDTVIIVADGHAYVWHEQVDPNCTDNGVIAHFTCDNCDTLFDEDLQVIKDTKINPLGHKLTWFDAKPATCVKDGTVGYFKCSVCRCYLDEGKNEIEDIVDYAEGHDYVWHEEVPSSCDTAGTIAHYTCNGCDKKFNAEKVEIGKIAIAPKHDLVWHEGKGATCDQDGYIAHNTCNDCDKLFNKYGEELDTIVVSIDHELVYVQGYAPTCSKEGVKAHYKCIYCGDLYDLNKNEITDVSIPVVEHDYSSKFLMDAEGHWNQCEDCGALSDKVAHDYKDGACACGVKDPNAKEGCASAVYANNAMFAFALTAILGVALVTIKKLRKR